MTTLERIEVEARGIPSLPVVLSAIGRVEDVGAELLALADSGAVWLHRHDHGAALTQAERHERNLLQDDRDPNVWYVAVSLR